LSGTAYELLNAGRELADKLSGELGAVVIGSGTEVLAKKAIGAGADICYTVENGDLNRFHDDAYANILVELIKAKSPQIILGPANFYGKALFGRLAALVGASLAADCISLSVSFSDNGTSFHPDG